MELIKYIPDFNLRGDIFRKIFTSRQAKIDEAKNNIEDLRNQCFIRTATWGLVYWEEEFGIKVDLSDDIENRRSRCLSRIRGSGNCTISHIKYVAKCYGYGDIDLNEDFEHYRLTITFISTFGIPPKLDDFKKTMRTIIPAHIGIYYKFKYNTWGDIKKANITWDYCKQNNITWEDLKNKPVDELLNL